MADEYYGGQQKTKSHLLLPALFSATGSCSIRMAHDTTTDAVDVLRGQRILVFGDDTRSFLAVVRGLGRRGAEVHAAPYDLRAPALKSRYVAAIHSLPAYQGDGAEWLAALEALHRAHRFTAIVPCDERSILPLDSHRAQLSERLGRPDNGGPILAMPAPQGLSVLFDKVETRDLARSVGVPVADGEVLGAVEDSAGSATGRTASETLVAQASRIAEKYGLPIAVKPRKSYEIQQLHGRFKVQIAHSVEELAAILGVIEPATHFVESFFPGRGVGLSVLAHEGRLVHAFQHDRVHEPRSAGGSTYRIAKPADPGLVRACGAMVGALGYSGIAMFEFRRNDGDGRWILLEVNARPWGSMPLPLALGVNFPGDWIAMLVTGKRPTAASYRPQIYGRNLLNDLYCIADLAKERRYGPLGRLSFFAAKSGEMIVRVLAGREKIDTIVRDDPRPGLAELNDFMRERFERTAATLPPVAWLRRRRDHRLFHEALQEVVRHGKTILFLCDGNICRSPFAAAVLQQALRSREQVGTPAATVVSAGMIPIDGRSSPLLAQEVAAKFGVRLEEHRSKYLRDDHLKDACLVVGFDTRNEHNYLARFSEPPVPFILLGRLDGGPLSIRDPIDGDKAVFAQVYGRISAIIIDAISAMDTPPTRPPTGAC